MADSRQLDDRRRTRLDDPDPHNLAHLAALHEAKRNDNRTSPPAWLAELSVSRRESPPRQTR